MKSRLIKKITDQHPYEIVEIEVIADSQSSITLDDYLSIQLGAVEIVSSNPPRYIIKRVKGNLGIG
ncbi:MAG: hypothetical protein RIA69_04725 [Cyclobacteriaceae bacterium]